ATNTGVGGDTLSDIENVLGSASADTLTGDINANTLTGNAGNDILDGGAGIDVLLGGDGDDTFTGRGDGDTFTGGEGVEASGDTLDYSSYGSALAVNLNTSTTDSGDTISEIENVIGSSTQINTLTASTENNVLTGGAADDIFYANTGDGTDTFDGAGGTDTVDYSSDSTITLNIGTDADTFTSIEVINATATADNITNDGTARTINAGADNDTITGGAAIDTLNGQAGDDTFILSAGADVIDGGTEGAGGDTYDVSAGAAATVNLATNTGVGGDTLSDIENVLGSASADTLTGDINANTLTGNAGDDILDGGDGDDVIDGGAGDDNIDGGDGDDGDDTISGGGNNDTLDYSGSSTAITSANFDNISNVTTTNSTGNVDTIDGVENFGLSDLNDTIDIDADAFSGLTSIDANNGTDHVNVNGLGAGNTLTDYTLEGTDFASLFTDVEELDFTNTDLTGADTFDIGNDDIDSITGAAGGDLTMFVDITSIAFTDINVLTQSGALITNDTTIGGVSRTIDWDNGAQLTIQSA
ncbi:MAG: calcium-binding protein, partial [Gammaproteobacteria bacterium]|nr:calcium-binding protein [Gammaproteobacteria bacterium]